MTTLRTLAALFLILTRPDGLPVYINAAEIVAFSKNTIGPKNAKTEITAHDRVFYVIESPEEILEKLK